MAITGGRKRLIFQHSHSTKAKAGGAKIGVDQVTGIAINLKNRWQYSIYYIFEADSSNPDVFQFEEDQDIATLTY